MAADLKTRDTVTSLLNYDVSDNDDDPFREIDTTIHEPTNKTNETKRKATVSDDKENTDILGLDEEVKVTKKRKPVAKLDEARLLSQPGIPKLRALVRSRAIASKLRLKGKGHEYSDAVKLLSYYQLWLDNLYPRAKFADGLQLVEKVGHSKRMQIMRREWIDEGKPGYGRNADDIHDPGKSNEGSGENGVVQSGRKQPDRDEGAIETNQLLHDGVLGDPDEGIDDDLFFADNAGTANVGDDNEPDEDELDALLAEQGSDINHQQPGRDQTTSKKDEADDLDALQAEQQAKASRSHSPERHQQKEAHPSGDDDLEALLAENEARLRLLSEKTQLAPSELPEEEKADELEHC